jgi:hypothetical protein
MYGKKQARKIETYNAYKAQALRIRERDENQKILDEIESKILDNAADTNDEMLLAGIEKRVSSAGRKHENRLNVKLEHLAKQAVLYPNYKTPQARKKLLDEKDFTNLVDSFMDYEVNYEFDDLKDCFVGCWGFHEGQFKRFLVEKVENKADYTSAILAAQNLIVPKTHKGLPIFIEDDAFSGNDLIRSVNINASGIGYGAFANCSNLQNVKISGAVSIGDGAFSGCPNLKMVDLGATEEINTECFLNSGAGIAGGTKFKLANKEAVIVDRVVEGKLKRQKEIKCGNISAVAREILS